MRTQYLYNGAKWLGWPSAVNLLNSAVQDFLEHEPIARAFADRLRSETGTNFFQWIDCIGIEGSDSALYTICSTGFIPELVPTSEDSVVLRHFNAHLPRIVFRFSGKMDREVTEIGIKCDSVEEFRWINNVNHPIEYRFKRFCRCLISEANGKKFYAIEKFGTLDSLRNLQFFCRWSCRQRVFSTDSQGMQKTLELAQGLVDQYGCDVSAHLCFFAEREYWQSRNSAGRFQRARQNKLGLGWANHDHHTFRSSREHFVMLIKILEALGFQCRERFYQGEEAGWGAQVLEQPVAGISIFADVDLDPHEKDIDFAHQPLPPREKLGTIGLWCALHGESILQAGLHHLEIECDFDEFRNQMNAEGVEVNKPFNDTSILRQAFTKGERWQVNPERLNKLLESKQIIQEQFEKFSQEGAIGSHLEHLERKKGFKGFREQGINEVILDTDPRTSTR